MQFRKLFTVLVLSIAALSACKKNQTAIQSLQATVKANDRLLLKTAQTYQTFEFEYNADRTIKTYSWGNGVYRMDFSYPQNKTVCTFSNAGKKAGYTEYELTKGIAQKETTTYYDANGNATVTYMSDYTYNANGQLLKEKYWKNGSGNGNSTYSYNSNGDLASTVYSEENGNVINKREYEYNLFLADKSYSFGQFNGSSQGSVFPKKSNHLILKQIITDNSGTKTYAYTYTMDAQGFVVSALIKDDFGAVSESWTNTWE